MVDKLLTTNEKQTMYVLPEQRMRLMVKISDGNTMRISLSLSKASKRYLISTFVLKEQAPINFQVPTF